MNKAEKSLRWVVNQIPDFTPKNNEEKMLVAIKLYSEAGAEEIKRLEAENAALRERLEKAVELPCIVGDIIYSINPFSKNIDEYKVISISFLLSQSVNHISVNALNYREALTTFEKYDFDKEWFTDKTKAEARLAELKGEQHG